MTVVRPPAEPNADAKARVTLSYRNVPSVDVTVHPVDLMQLYLVRRNLDAIAGVDLARITPVIEQTVALGSGEDYEDKKKDIELPLTRNGAYLVMIRGGDLYASGVVLVSPLEVNVLEEPGPGRVRVVVRDARTGEPVGRVQVKVVAADPDFHSEGETDLAASSRPRASTAATVVVRRRRRPSTPSIAARSRRPGSATPGAGRRHREGEGREPVARRQPQVAQPEEQPEADRAAPEPLSGRPPATARRRRR